jgi:hypothetical protein
MLSISLLFLFLHSEYSLIISFLRTFASGENIQESNKKIEDKQKEIEKLKEELKSKPDGDEEYDFNQSEKELRTIKTLLKLLYYLFDYYL